MTPEITIDAKQAYARFSKAGIPESVRNSLRRLIPDLTKKLGDVVERKLNTELKSRRRLVVRKEMIENPQRLVGRVTIVATSPPGMLPTWLESGTSPHVIAARSARSLYFYWDKIGGFANFKQVMHPGTKAYRFAENALEEMQAEIVDALSQAVKEGAAAA